MTADKLPIKFKPKYRLTKKLLSRLIKIESIKASFEALPVTPKLLISLRHSARLLSTHYSTAIEGNRLSEVEVEELARGKKMEKSRKRDEKEVLGYFAAFDEMEKISEERKTIKEENIQILHALVMGGGKKRIKPSPYRTQQNVIRESRGGRIVYLPPEAKDVPKLMEQLIVWLDKAEKEDVPCPIRAAIAHYQFATIHPYIDGNGRTARLFATLVLRLGGYGLKGIYSLDEYYAKDLQGYYDALSVGPSHNYYEGRAKSDISKWIEYFVEGMAESFEQMKRKTEEAKENKPDQSNLLNRLDARQKAALALFGRKDWINANDLAEYLKLKERNARLLCQSWVKEGFLSILDPSRKKRKYGLGEEWKKLL